MPPLQRLIVQYGNPLLTNILDVASHFVCFENCELVEAVHIFSTLYYAEDNIMVFTIVQHYRSTYKGSVK